MPARLPDHLKRNAAARARDWRAKRRQLSLPLLSGPSGKSGKTPSLFDGGEFVAIDGEGFSEGETFSIKVEASQATYTTQNHYYALLSASDGSEIYAPEGRLSMQACLDFVLAIKERNKRAIIVCFGGSYDMCQMLAHELTVDQVKVLLGGGGSLEGPIGSKNYLDITLGDSDYRLELRPRKSLTVMRWPHGAPKYERDNKGKLKKTDCDQATIWDVWGFFQDSFVGVMSKWIPNHADYQFIKRMKGERSIFARSEIAEIRDYNAAELRCLVAIMNALRDAVAALGLKLTRWDGAGAIAAAMLKLHSVKEHKQEPPAPVFEAARCAYSGGHIEVCQIGYHDGAIFHYDVNSAYPSEFAELPSLAGGVWIHGTGEPPPGFTVVRTRWEFNDGNSFYPLFYRSPDATIIYPRDGEGWHWFPEWDAGRYYAETFGAKRFDVVEWWHLKPATDQKPFGWVRDYYSRRMQLVASAKAMGAPNGEEKIIKLGLNSLYGKTAQQVGARMIEGQIQAPAYFQLEWAGMVTAGCRAKLMMAAMQNMTAIIGFATDGIFSTQPLDLHCPEAKELGAWEAQTHDGITMVMPGVYWLHHNGQKPKHYSRGFDKAQMSDAEFIHHAWKKGQKTVPLELTRLIGLGSACASSSLWPIRGSFARSKRALALNGCNSKRHPINPRKSYPNLGLVPTIPVERDIDTNDDYGNPLLSAPYPIDWIDGADDFGLSLSEEKEAIDAELA